MIENTAITIDDARVCVIGQGTIGAVLARYMVALGARTHVAARNPEQRAAAYVAGATPHTLDELPALARRLDMVFSTVPSQVVGADILERLPKSALLVDLAAPPGGIDFEAARRLGLRAIWGRGLGSRAPVTVGGSQWGGIGRNASRRSCARRVERPSKPSRTQHARRHRRDVDRTHPRAELARPRRAITDAMVQHAGAKAANLHVILQEVPKEDWALAGVLGDERKDA